ncbi:MAG: DUF3868 domain-containing protein [Bacteroidia bacterium]|nr:DUF3868 domain-containing protein [Bacteroidia bacterium]
MRKIKYFLYIYFVIFSGFSLLAQETKSYMNELVIENQSVKRDSGKVYVDMGINMGALKINPKHTIILTPYIIPIPALSDTLSAVTDTLSLSVDTLLVTVDTLRLPAVVINGKNRHTAYRRAQLLGKPAVWNDGNIYNIQSRDKEVPQHLGYSVSLAFEPWMRKAQLFIKEEVTGCASCPVGEADSLLNEKILPSDFIPSFLISYVTPEAEPVKARSEQYTARFTYRVGRSELLPEVGNNARELEQVDKVVRNIVNDKDLTMNKLAISGYASPEGGFDSNMRLSRDRAYSFSSYLERNYNLNASQFDVTWHGEDWNGLRKIVEQSSLPEKSEIVRIIDSESNPDRRDAPLRRLSRGATYKNLLDNYYPQLRRNEYAVEYNIRAFDAQEGREIIKTRPQLMSLNEMFLVAQTYEKDSPEFKEVFDIAARLFPQNPTAQLNAAAVDLEGGNVDAALNRLEKVKDMPDSWNNLGVAMFRKQKYAEAMKYFKLSVDKNDENAKANIEQLKQFIEEKEIKL